MKVQLSQQSIRFRVSQEEFQRLRDERVLIGTTDFPEGLAIRYEVRVSGEACGIKLQGTRIVLQLSDSELSRLAGSPPSKKSGANFEVQLEGDAALRVCFETDFFSSRKHEA